ncbi:hypothetical protein BH24ACI4_BH24ACI4_01360 [soil metagenome]|jgi:hypothetical protein
MTPTDEDALRVLIRQAVARQLGPDGSARSVDVSNAPQAHASHYRYALPETDGPCLIEPAVRCNHCGYCQSHGH